MNKIQEAFLELFRGLGDGCVFVDSMRCEGMDEVHLVDANQWDIIRDSSEKSPPGIPLVLDVLEK